MSSAASGVIRPCAFIEVMRGQASGEEAAVPSIEDAVLLCLVEGAVRVAVEGRGHAGAVGGGGVRQSERVAELMHHSAVPAGHRLGLAGGAVGVVSAQQYPAGLGSASGLADLFRADLGDEQPSAVRVVQAE